MKNKILKLFFVLIPICGFAISKEGEDLIAIENLIASTERQLVLYKELSALMIKFKNDQEFFVTCKGPEAKEVASRMIQTASNILKTAEDHHLMYLFTPFYIEELKLFAALPKKKAL